MRYIANVLDHPPIKRIMIHDTQNGAYLFTFEIEDDGGCSADEWYETLDIALEAAENRYDVPPGTWKEIPDPPEHCQQDWIAPARIPGRETGNPQLGGTLEVFRDGSWIQITG